jgi:hypothetical protein
LKYVVELRVHNVSPRFVRELRELGFKDLELDELVGLTYRHITPRFVREMRREYGENLSLSQLLE